MSELLHHIWHRPWLYRWRDSDGSSWWFCNHCNAYYPKRWFV